MDNMHVVKETTLTVEKKPLIIPSLGSITLQTSAKLKKSLEKILNSCEIQAGFRS